ncbi:MAG: RnfABCDGE type electron transport complex subunit G [Bacteroidaceae bacterium]
MKKLESTWYNMVGVLTVIAVVAGIALASVNSITREPIAAINKQTLDNGIKAVLQSESLTVQTIDSLASDVIVYRTTNGNAVQVTDKKGFGGDLTVLVGFADDGSIMGYQVLQSSETPGLGAKADTWFREGNGSIIGRNPGNENLTVKKDGGDVDAITASTITSRAFLRCVNNAYKALQEDALADGESGASKQVHHDCPQPVEEPIAADNLQNDTTKL